MEVVCTQEHLQTGLEIVERIAGRNPTLPALKNVLLEGKQGRLFFTTTDLELALKTWIPAKIEKEGLVSLPAKLFSNFVRQLPAKNVHIRAKQQATITCEEHEAILQTTDPRDFPLIPHPKKRKAFTMTAEPLIRALTQVLPMAAQSETRPELNGVALFFTPGQFTCVATDTFRLAEQREEEADIDFEHSSILPPHAVQEMVRVFSAKGKISMMLGYNQILFEQGETELISRLVEGEYPKYREIIPQEIGTRVFLSRSSFLQHLRITGLFTGRLQNVSIRVDSEKGELSLNAKQEGVGEHRSSFPVKVRGTGMEIAFNHRYLIDGLQAIAQEEILLELHGAEKPTVMKPQKTTGFLYLVMPIKI